MKYLIDECSSNSFDRKVGQKDSSFVTSVSVLGTGATDEEIYEYAKARNMTIITRDLKFELFLLSKNHPVIYKFLDKHILMKPIKVPDMLTASLLERDKVVIP